MSKRILGDLFDEVLALALREDRSLASMVRVLIREALAERSREASVKKALLNFGETKRKALAEIGANEDRSSFGGGS